MAAVRRLAAIMFTDVVGFTALGQTDEASALTLLREEEKLVRPLLKRHRGRLIKSTGDGFLVEFDSALRAVQCAIDIQQHLQERNSQKGLTPLLLRIGIHLGDVVAREGDIFGDAVNIASRVEPLAVPGGVCISGEVFHQVRNKIPNRFDKLEPRTLKNIRVPIEVYRVVLPWEVPEPAFSNGNRTRLAVLPFANISPESKDEYFADGLTEELISALSKLRKLRVIARTSVTQYKSAPRSVSQIGAELGVSSVLEGSVRKAGNRLRITLQLIDVGTQEPLWADVYDRELDDVFAIQSDIAEKTARALQIELLGPERESIQRKPTPNLAAYSLFLKGIHVSRMTRLGGSLEGIRCFEEAIEKDPSFSLAYSYLANMYVSLAGEPLPHREAFERATELVNTALKLDPNSSEAHTARGNLALQHEHDWALADRELATALSLNPSNADAHWWRAQFLVVVNRLDEAIDEIRATLELDPLWELPIFALISVYFLTGDVTSAIAGAEEQRDRKPEAPEVHVVLSYLYASVGRVEDSQREVELSAGSLNESDRWYRAVVWAMLGNPEEARRVLTEKIEASRTEYVAPTTIAQLYAALGEREKALEWLDRDYETGGGFLALVYHNPGFYSMRDDPRFRAMLARLNLPSDGTSLWSAGTKS
ncbi:MAG: adenylate/guanylate cyclase domain-containing protein [Thermoplasmata archaeon]